MTKQSGNMYPWVTNMHSHLRGQCPHECDYCYTQHMRCARFYQGELKLNEKELEVNYGEGKTIFIEHMNDLFADGIIYVDDILNHCLEYPNNKYVFQTKNPFNAFEYLDNDDWSHMDFMVGTTIETTDANLLKLHSKAPPPIDRMVWITAIGLKLGVKTFITLEPIMEFDLKTMMDWLVEARPDFVNIGADSKKCGLLEPTKEEIEKLLLCLKLEKIEVREKHNLDRLMK